MGEKNLEVLRIENILDNYEGPLTSCRVFFTPAQTAEAKEGVFGRKPVSQVEAETMHSDTCLSWRQIEC